MGVLAFIGREEVIRFTLFHRGLSGVPAAARGRKRAAAYVVSRSEEARLLGRTADEHLLRLLLVEVDLGHGFLSWTTRRLLAARWKDDARRC